MKSITLYRGITVSQREADSVIHDIKTNGLNQNDKQTWGGFIWKDIKSNISTLYNKEDLTRDVTSPASDLIKKGNGWARNYSEGELSLYFADKIGAEYYAAKHNVTKDKKVPILITCDLDLENIAIDGRDFLYTVFGFIEPKNIEKTKRQTKKLKSLYGQNIEKYVEKIIMHPKSDKNAICDLIICDDEIIIDHSKNSEIIGGRHGTIYKSAFFGKTPILPVKIQNVEIINDFFPHMSPTITLSDILER